MLALGCLEGEEKSHTTVSTNTLAAISAGLELLSPGGHFSVIAYTYHRGGRDEAEVINKWAVLCPDSSTG